LRKCRHKKKAAGFRPRLCIDWIIQLVHERAGFIIIIIKVIIIGVGSGQIVYHFMLFMIILVIQVIILHEHL
jgi:hypothetical protein